MHEWTEDQQREIDELKRAGDFTPDQFDTPEAVAYAADILAQLEVWNAALDVQHAEAVAVMEASTVPDDGVLVGVMTDLHPASGPGFESAAGVED